MTASEREGLVERIRQARRQSGANTPGPEPADAVRREALETRLAQLEELVKGLQDSVYRESQRHDRRITELEAQVEPAALAAALSKDARERGL